MQKGARLRRRPPRQAIDETGRQVQRCDSDQPAVEPKQCAQIAVDVTPALSVNFAVSNLGNEDLARKSPLYTWTDAPRTWRMTLRGQW